ARRPLPRALAPARARPRGEARLAPRACHDDVGATGLPFGDDEPAADREPHASSILKSCAPSQSASRPTSASCSLPSTTVAKWLPASCPTLLANIVEP